MCGCMCWKQHLDDGACDMRSSALVQRSQGSAWHAVGKRRQQKAPGTVHSSAPMLVLTLGAGSNSCEQQLRKLSFALGKQPSNLFCAPCRFILRDAAHRRASLFPGTVGEVRVQADHWLPACQLSYQAPAGTLPCPRAAW